MLYHVTLYRSGCEINLSKSMNNKEYVINVVCKERIVTVRASNELNFYILEIHVVKKMPDHIRTEKTILSGYRFKKNFNVMKKLLSFYI